MIRAIRGLKTSAVSPLHGSLSNTFLVFRAGVFDTVLPVNSATSEFGLSDIGQIAVTINDLDQAVAFYRDVLGLKHLFSAPPGLAFFACGSIRLMLSRPEKPDAERFSTALYFKVADIQSAHASLAGRGVVFEAVPHLIAKMPDHELWMAFFRDPDRNLLALMCEKRS